MISRYLFSFSIVIVQILLFTNICLGATLWKSGYFISNSGDTTQCLIKDEDWKNNPTQFKWKKSYDAETRIASIEFVSFFSIDSNSMYIRDTIQFETSSTKIDHLSDSRDPEFESKIVFLRVLVLGDASLYYYEKGDAQRYFFSHSDQPSPEALIYKMYRSDDDQVRQNFKFREQIWKSTDCKEITLKSINDLEYDRKELVQLFIEINKCLGSDFINYDQFRTKGTFKVSAFLAANVMPSTLTNDFRQIEADFAFSTTWQVGIEFEYLLPFWNNKWSAFVAPSLLRYESFSGSTKLRFLTLDMQFAARRYFTIFRDETIFLNAGIVLSYPITSEFKTGSNSIDVSPSRNFIIGAGYQIVDRVSAEIRCGIDRDLGWNNAWRVDSYYYGLLLSVNLF